MLYYNEAISYWLCQLGTCTLSTHSQGKDLTFKNSLEAQVNSMQNIYSSVPIFIIAHPVLFIALTRVARANWNIHVNSFHWKGVEGLLWNNYSHFSGNKSVKWELIISIHYATSEIYSEVMNKKNLTVYWLKLLLNIHWILFSREKNHVY